MGNRIYKPLHGDSPYDSLFEIPVYSISQKPLTIPKRQKNFVLFIPSNPSAAIEQLTPTVKKIEEECLKNECGVTIIPTHSYSSHKRLNYSELEADFYRNFPNLKEKSTMVLTEDLKSPGGDMIRFLFGRMNEDFPKRSLAAFKLEEAQEFDSRLKRTINLQFFKKFDART